MRRAPVLGALTVVALLTVGCGTTDSTPPTTAASVSSTVDARPDISSAVASSQTTVQGELTSGSSTTAVVTQTTTESTTTAALSDRVTITIPDTIQGDERAKAEAAIVVLGEAMKVEDSALGDATAQDWAPVISEFWGGVVEVQLNDNAKQFADDGWHQVGQASVVGQVAAVSLDAVVIETCYDASVLDVVDSQGRSVAVGVQRGPVTFRVTNYGEPFGWLVDDRVSDSAGAGAAC